MRQHHPIEFLLDMAKLHIVGFQEIAAGRNIEKKIFHRNRGSVTGCCRCMLFNLGALNLQQCTRAILCHFGTQFHMGDSCDRCQSLSTEALGREVEKVVGSSKFGSSVPFKAQARIVKAHTFAVVHHLD